jgi:hypothetical protein
VTKLIHQMRVRSRCRSAGVPELTTFRSRSFRHLNHHGPNANRIDFSPALLVTCAADSAELAPTRTRVQPSRTVRTDNGRTRSRNRPGNVNLVRCAATSAGSEGELERHAAKPGASAMEPVAVADEAARFAGNAASSMSLRPARMRVGRVRSLCGRSAIEACDLACDVVSPAARPANPAGDSAGSAGGMAMWERDMCALAAASGTAQSFRPARNCSGQGRSRMCRRRICVGQSQSRSGRRAIAPARAASASGGSASLSANHKVVPAGAESFRPWAKSYVSASDLCRTITKSFRPAGNCVGHGRNRMCRVRNCVGQSQSRSGRRGIAPASAEVVCVDFELVSANPKVAPAGAELLRPLRKSSTPLE